MIRSRSRKSGSRKRKNRNVEREKPTPMPMLASEASNVNMVSGKTPNCQFLNAEVRGVISVDEDVMKIVVTAILREASTQLARIQHAM